MKNIFKATMLMITVVLMAVAIAPMVKAEVTANESIPTDMIVPVPCANGGAGEDVSLSGRLHMLMSQTENGNVTSYKFLFQPQGMSGIGSITGDKYQATGVTQMEYGEQLAPGQQLHQTFVNNFRVIGQGPDNNFVVHEVFHLTINANGEVSVQLDNLSVECK